MKQFKGYPASADATPVSKNLCAPKKLRNPQLRKRTPHIIAIDILEATLSSEKKMRIMYKTNLNFDRFNSYFYDLTYKGFIEEVTGLDGKPAYKISDRGKVLLETLRKAEELFTT